MPKWASVAQRFRASPLLGGVTGFCTGMLIRLVYECFRLPFDCWWQALFQPNLPFPSFLRAYHPLRRFWHTYSVCFFLNRLPQAQSCLFSNIRHLAEPVMTSSW